MPDLVVGLGEIGEPLGRYLMLRGFTVEGYDIKTNTKIQKSYDMIHICFPYGKDFIKAVKFYKKLGPVVIHSTVKPGTSKKLNCIYSPIRGLHKILLAELKGFSKYYSGVPSKEFEKRFPNCVNVPDSEILENTKILVDSEYYRILIEYRKAVDKNYKVYWHFANEINARFGNRPILYNDNKEIGGHCVKENHQLLSNPEFFKNEL